jgi:outer membrane protein assembly factor BamA
MSPKALKGFNVRQSTITSQHKEEINKEVPPGAPMVVKSTNVSGAPVGPGYTVIPLPAFTYNRNEGYWAGALTPIFRANAKGEVEDIYAPLYLHNELIGETFTFNYFGYRHETTQFHVILSHATKIERTVDVGYKNTAALDGQYIFGLVANTGKSAFNRFFGGNSSLQSSESQYTLADANFKLTGGVHLTEGLSVLASERYRVTNIEAGASPSLPQTSVAFPTTPGIDGSEVVGHGLTMAYDTRDNELTPLEGTYVTAFTEYDQNIKFSERNRWWRITGEWRYFLPHDDYQMVFVPHFLIDSEVGQDSNSVAGAPGSSVQVNQGVPFYERPTLGGENTLRGFGRDRFVSNVAYVLNLEERITLSQRSLMGNVIELELAPFLDMGRVASGWGSDDLIKRMQVNPGIGLRALARPNIACRLDVGYGRDGANAYVGLDYPF